jgi:hypothetical protein
MQVIMQITAGPSVGRKIRVHPDRITQCGKSTRADIGFPHDEAMSDLHFEISFPDGAPRLRDMGSERGTEVNGQPVLGAVELRDQDEIAAGRTRILVRVDAADRVSPVLGAAAGIAGAEPKIRTALEFCKPLDLSEEARLRLDDQLTPPAYLRRLDQDGLREDALKVLAYWLPARRSVWWGWSCVRESASARLKPDDLIAFNAAYDWVADPSDAVRRAAFATAEHAKMQGPGAWLSVAAFWSGDSLAPPNLPKVPPAPTLCGQAVAVALTLAAAPLPPPEAATLRQGWIAKGLALAEPAEIEWPAPPRRDPDLPPTRQNAP